MITVIVILLAVTSAFKTLSIAFVQKSLSEDKVIAINLAREGMEAVRYIRDYNWFYYGSEKRICWNHLEDNNNNGQRGDDSSCTEDGSNGYAKHQIADSGEQEYILKQDGTHWFITTKGYNYNGASGAPNISDNWKDLDKDTIGTKEGTEAAIGENRSSNTNNTIESFRLCKKEELYISCNDIPTGDQYITKFFRYIKIQYDSNPKSTTDINGNGLTDGQEVNKMTVTVGVKWLEKGNVQDVVLVTLLTDFYERTPIDGMN